MCISKLHEEKIRYLPVLVAPVTGFEKGHQTNVILDDHTKHLREQELQYGTKKENL
jgi:hypothetical protein